MVQGAFEGEGVSKICKELDANAKKMK